MKIIMTAHRSNEDSVVNFENQCEMLTTIDRKLGVTGIPVDGVWKGEAERSYMFGGVVSEDIAFFQQLANKYNQDAILLIRDDKRCVLLNRDGSMLDVGDWQQVDRDIAIQFDGYSKVGFDYFVAATREQIAAKQRRLLATQASVIAAQEYSARLSAVGGV